LKQADRVFGKGICFIEVRHILAVLQNCKTRVEHSFLGSILNDFLDGRENLDEEIKLAHTELSTCEQSLAPSRVS
jgi:hypothetical protein